MKILDPRVKDGVVLYTSGAMAKRFVKEGTMS
jgi:hypothetical protein